MRRGIQHSEKPYWGNDFLVQAQFKSASATEFNTKKQRKNKDIEDEICCQSDGNILKESEDKYETARTCQFVSPESQVPTLEAKLPLRKFYKLYSKIVVQLDAVKNLTETKKNESETLVDLRRQLQRADEFSIRFSRNNLYEAKRIINEIKQFLVPHPSESLSPGNCRILCKKIILAYQAASQSLQTYINYVKNPSNLEVPEKINELVLIIADLFLCCENVSLPAQDARIKNDAVKICNELMTLLKSKVPVCEYVELKEADLAKNRTKTTVEDWQKMEKLSMYKPKMPPKIKAEAPRKKIAMHSLFGMKSKKPKKKDEKIAKITHEIYTQKLNPWPGKGLGNKIVKFKAETEQKTENLEEKKIHMRRGRYITPREVRSQDDDVETMVQTIGDDEVSTWRLGSTPREIDEEQNDLEILLDAIEGLQKGDKKEQKISLNKLLNSIQNCSKTQYQPPNPDRVKVFHFISNDFLEEINSKGDKPKEETQDSVVVPENQTSSEKVSPGERKLKLIFKPLKGNSAHERGNSNAKDRVKLRLSEEAVNNAIKYRKAFADYRKNNIMYKKTLANKPWELVSKVSDHIILDIIREISLDFQNDAILRRLYLSELQEVTS